MARWVNSSQRQRRLPPGATLPTGVFPWLLHSFVPQPMQLVLCIPLPTGPACSPCPILRSVAGAGPRACARWRSPLVGSAEWADQGAAHVQPGQRRGRQQGRCQADSISPSPPHGPRGLGAGATAGAKWVAPASALLCLTWLLSCLSPPVFCCAAGCRARFEQLCAVRPRPLPAGPPADVEWSRRGAQRRKPAAPRGSAPA